MLSAVLNLNFFQFTFPVKSQLWMNLIICLPWAWQGWNIFFKKITQHSQLVLLSVCYHKLQIGAIVPAAVSVSHFWNYYLYLFISDFSNLLLPGYFKFSSENRRYYIQMSSSFHHKTLQSPPSCLGNHLLPFCDYGGSFKGQLLFCCGSHPLLPFQGLSSGFPLSLFCVISLCLQWIILIRLQICSSVPHLNHMFPCSRPVHLWVMSQLSFITILLYRVILINCLHFLIF